ncbi:uncharacterized protein LOC115720240 [Cannabis sativa]|uniref:uncharacterized protein LOC115720240 n=1 Tax=Cannabis sativa TaxID=3483 RepID=UPI0029CA2BF4|nr:uncharacterized protein LOC115720240 [Cannabis sativa]
MAPYDALYGRPCRLPLRWEKLDQHVTIGPKIITSTDEKIKGIQEQLKVIQSRQKTYVELHQREVELDVSDYVFLKVTPIRVVTRFEVKEDVTYEEQPVRISSRNLKSLRNREIPIVKILWQNHREDNAT